jgi:hypothetical protein
MDKSAWGDGPWQSEPDDRMWTDELTGLRCALHRAELTGAWCGYVAVPVDHPWHVLLALHDFSFDVDVHGGVTFAGQFDGPDWWIGFDCGHAFDYMPATVAELRRIGVEPAPLFADAHYWTVDEVVAEVARLAEQVAWSSVATR